MLRMCRTRIHVNPVYLWVARACPVISIGLKADVSLVHSVNLCATIVLQSLEGHHTWCDVR